ncbi:WYL domain-containing protein [Microbacterium sediminicola]|uniref:WYL domain-containing protein n=1 Tax=Microbacterium sediminicola TaxID=415210 RepID=A0ABN2HUK4_9MICO
MSTRASSKTPPEQRLVNLVVALAGTEIGLRKDTILATVAGYREQSESGVAKVALEKMFERDKETLRGLGVPIETIGDPADPDDLREARYRVPVSEYQLPADIEFSPAELALLNLAGGVWSESSMSEDARTGLRKIRALGIEVDSPIVGYAPRVNVREAAFVPLQTAIDQSRTVVFTYLRPGGSEARRRRMQPYALVEYEARWHVYGHDLDLGEERTFLLSRIAGEVELGAAVDPDPRASGAGTRALAQLEQLAAQQRALVEITPGTEAALRLARRADPAAQGHWVPYVDVHIFADELASYGPEVRVVEPASLREQVIDRLTRAIAAHTDTEGGA